MNKIKKLMIKSDFFKAIEGHPESWTNISLYYFNGDVYKLNDKLKDDLTLCLSHILGTKVMIDPEYSDENRLVLTISDRYDEIYELFEGRIVPIGTIRNIDFLNSAINKWKSLDLFYKAYVDLMEKYKTVLIPITKRVSYGYDFYNGYFFELVDKKDASKKIKIHVFGLMQDSPDTDNDCYIAWDDVEVLVKSIRISPDYRNDLNMLNDVLDDRIKLLKNDLEIMEVDGYEYAVDEKCIYPVTKDDNENRFLIREDNLFEIIEGVKCIREEWKQNLRYLDLSNISFEGVYIAGLDFTGSNALINPDTVYNKDVCFCVFDRRNLVANARHLDECIINDTDSCNVNGRLKKR